MDLEEKNLEAALEASGRVRHVLMSLQIYGLLIVLVYINSSPWGGFRSRQKLAEDAGRLYECDTAPRFVTPIGDGHTVKWNTLDRTVGSPMSWKGQTPSERYDDFLHRRDDHLLIRSLQWSMACAPQFEQERMAVVAQWILERRMSSAMVQDELKRINDDLRSVLYDVPIPVAGLKVDVNVFSLVGAAGHVLLLLWLLLAARQEVINIANLAPQAKRLVRQRMLFFPADGRASRRAYYFTRLVVALTVGAPLIPLILTAWQDYGVRGTMEGRYPGSYTIIVLEMCFCFLALALSGLCLRKMCSNDEKKETLKAPPTEIDQNKALQAG